MVKLTEPSRFPSHRFIDWNEGRNYAFAKGLAVSPQHLPIALDAMLAEGWELHSIFGETETQSVGFIFRRVAPMQGTRILGDNE